MSITDARSLLLSLIETERAKERINREAAIRYAGADVSRAFAEQTGKSEYMATQLERVLREMDRC